VSERPYVGKAISLGEMAMKCPNCGKENSESGYYCGWCNASLKEPTPSTDSPTNSSEPEPLPEPITQMELLVENRFLRIFMMIGGIISAIFGAIFAIAGAYAIAGGSNVAFTINDRMVSAEEGGPIFLVIGLVLLFVGFSLRYAYHKQRPARTG